MARAFWVCLAADGLRRAEAPRCLIVDDHPVVRAGVRAVIEAAWKEAEVADATTLEDASVMLQEVTPTW